MKEICLKVKGMMCEGCENRVKNTLMDMEGVSEVKPSYKEEKVVVIVNDSIDVDDITEKIEDIGYDVIEEGA